MSVVISQALKYGPNEESVWLTSQRQQATGMLCKKKVATKLKISPRPQRSLL